jgi:gluconate 2-dehydrogenase subunit 3-like protein
MKPLDQARRSFLIQAGGTAAATLLSAQWPAILSAAQHAHEAASSAKPALFEILTPGQAREVEAIAAQIIPSDDSPGAQEAGVVYFIDRALKTFAADAVPLYQKGLAELKQRTSEKFPGVKGFADATPEQQETLIAELAESPDADFFQVIRRHTIFGFLVDPEAGGNRDYAGWKVIGRDPAHSFSPPFGFYDKDYPGWQPSSPETRKR